MRVVWSDRAIARVSEIASFISTDDPEAAVRWVVALFDAVEALGEFPEMGKPGRDVAALGVRGLDFGDFRVFYEADTVVTILTVRRSQQIIDESELAR
ncbi:MAG: type II toxin-antitoxin system RelE/ParE family toxin [Coriobacteriia bacterium]